MIKKLFVFISVSLLVLLASTEPASAQSSKEAEGRAAEQAGKLREALTHYVAALQSVPEGSADDQRIKETVIRLVQKLSPPPSIPEEATRFSVRGEIAIKEAKSTADFGEAAKEFSKAVRVAPWWADGYINLAVAQEKAGQLTDAIRSLKLYLLAAPASLDAEKVKRQIYALEYRQEKAQKEMVAEREEQERKRREAERKRTQQATLIRDLAGTWQSSDSRFQAAVSGNSIVITKTHWLLLPERVWVPIQGHPYGPGIGTKFDGELEGLSIKGVVVLDFRLTHRNGEIFTRPMTGTISPDGRRIHLEFTAVNPAGSRPGNMAAGWFEKKASTDLERQ